jgi:opacity protein-like surface antigen
MHFLHSRSQAAALAIAALVFGASHGQAAMKAGENRLSIQGGAAIPTGVNDLNQAHSVGFVTGAQYLRGLNDRVQIGAQADYLMLPGKDQTVTSSAGGLLDADAKADVVIVEAVSRYTLCPESKWSPYAALGVGVARFHQKSKATPQSGSSWVDTSTTEEREVASDVKAGFAASLGGGVETMLTDRLSLGVEALWHWIGADEDDFGTSVVNVPTVGIRMGWTF